MTENTRTIIDMTTGILVAILLISSLIYFNSFQNNQALIDIVPAYSGIEKQESENIINPTDKSRSELPILKDQNNILIDNTNDPYSIISVINSTPNSFYSLISYLLFAIILSGTMYFILKRRLIK